MVEAVFSAGEIQHMSLFKRLDLLGHYGVHFFSCLKFLEIFSCLKFLEIWKFVTIPVTIFVVNLVAAGDELLHRDSP